MKMASVTDGTSNTLLASEVHAWTAYTRNGGPPTTNIPATLADAQAAVAPVWETVYCLKVMGRDIPNGQILTANSGFTTTLTPNTKVPYTFSGVTYNNCDFNSRQEGSNTTKVSYAVLTSEAITRAR
ncbi:MAG: DUF1559 domain-containing protein [Pirellulales bacterium]